MPDVSYPATRPGEAIDLTRPWVFFETINFQLLDGNDLTKIGEIETNSAHYCGSFNAMSKEVLDLHYGRKCVRRWSREFYRVQRKHNIATYIPLALVERRARRLLSKCLTPIQWRQYKTKGYFEVEAHDRLFQIMGYNGINEITHNLKPTSQVVVNGNTTVITTTFDLESKVIRRYCLHAASWKMPQADVLIIQKLMIEKDFERFETVANMDLGPGHPDYKEDEDIWLWSDERRMEVVLQRNNGIDPPYSPSGGKVGPRYLIPRKSKKEITDEENSLIDLDKAVKTSDAFTRELDTLNKYVQACVKTMRESKSETIDVQLI